MLIRCSQSTEKNVTNEHVEPVVDTDTTEAIKITIPESEFISLMVVADKVVAYNLNGRIGSESHMECPSVFNEEEGVLCSSCEAVTQLEPKQIIQLLEIISTPNTYDCVSEVSKTLCHIPHIGFVFYVNDTYIGHVNVSLLCESITCSPAVECETLSNEGLNKLTQFAAALDLRIINAESELNF